MRAYQVLDVGTVVVNHTTAIRVETLPFGGNKGSAATAREGIHDTLHEMTKQKTLLLHEIFGGGRLSRMLARPPHQQELRRQSGADATFRSRRRRRACSRSAARTAPASRR